MAIIDVVAALSECGTDLKLSACSHRYFLGKILKLCLIYPQRCEESQVGENVWICMKSFSSVKKYLGHMLSLSNVTIFADLCLIFLIS